MSPQEYTEDNDMVFHKTFGLNLESPDHLVETLGKL